MKRILQLAVVAAVVAALALITAGCGSNNADPSLTKTLNELRTEHEHASRSLEREEAFLKAAREREAGR